MGHAPPFRRAGQPPAIQSTPLAAATAAYLGVIGGAFHLLADPTAEYTDLGPDFYTRRIDLARRTNHLTHQLQALGYNVQLTPADAA